MKKTQEAIDLRWFYGGVKSVMGINFEEFFMSAEDNELHVRVDDTPSQPVAPFVTLDQVQALIEQAVLDLRSELRKGFDELLTKLRQQHSSEIAKVQFAVDALGARVTALENRLTKVEDGLAKVTGRQPATEFYKGLPPIDKITKIKAQLFINEYDPNFPKRARVQIKLYVWTCPPNMVADYLAGNVTSQMLIPLHRPDRSEGRKRLRAIGILKKIESSDQTIERAGKWAGTNHVVTIREGGRLLISHGEQTLDFGLPRPKRDDDADGASALRWYYPDNHTKVDTVSR